MSEHFILHQMEIDDWLLFGEKITLKDIENQFVKNPDAPIFPLSGIIRIKRSYDVMQTGPKTLCTNDHDISKVIKEMAGEGFRIQNLAWGVHPVKIIESTLNGIPVRIGWVGLNCGGPTICISYLFPQHKTSYEDDLAIWDRFLNETKECTQEEMKSIYDKIKLHSIQSSNA